MESRSDGEKEMMEVYACGLSNFIDSGLKGKAGREVHVGGAKNEEHSDEGFW